MTDIDAIRKTKRYERYFDGMREERKGRYVTAIALDAALLAYDAKCEELARLRGELADERAEFVRHCGCEYDGIETGDVKLVAECMTHTELRAERDAAVRERDGLRDALKEVRPVIERAELLLASFARKPTMAAYKADVLSTGMNLAHSLAAIDAQLAALAPPTEQPKRPCTCHPDDNPPRPCPGRYALQECRDAAALAKPVSP